MIKEGERLTEKYLSWLRSEIQHKQFDEWVEITTPFLDRNNDYIQIYLKKNNHGYVISDDGATIRELTMSGLDLKSPARKSLLTTNLNGFGIKLSDDGELFVQATENNYAQKKHLLLQAILAVNDMFYLSRSYVRSLFYEDVISWLEEKNIKGLRNMNVIGKSGFTHVIDYAVPHSRNMLDKFIQIISKPSKDTVNSSLFLYSDISSVRDNVEPFIILNDTEDPIKQEITEACVNYNIEPINWSKKENFIERLTV